MQRGIWKETAIRWSARGIAVFWPRVYSSEAPTQKIGTGKFRKTETSGNRKSLVIVLGMNLTEIRQPLARTQNMFLNSSPIGNGNSEKNMGNRADYALIEAAYGVTETD